MTIDELDAEIKSLEDQIALNNSSNDVRNYGHLNKRHQRQIELCRLAKIGLSGTPTRLCVTCGKEVDADRYKRGDAVDDCKSPDACTLDMTDKEALLYWRQKAHEFQTPEQLKQANDAAFNEGIEAAAEVVPLIYQLASLSQLKRT